MTGAGRLRTAGAWLLAMAIAGAASASNVSTGVAGFDRQVDALRTEVAANPAAGLGRLDSLANQAKALPPSARPIGGAMIDWLRAEALLRTNRPAEAKVIVDRALPAVEKLAADSKLHGDLLIARGGAFSSTADVPRALKDYQEAYAVFGRAGEPRGQAVALQDIGAIYSDAGDFENAIKYNSQSIDTYGGDPALLLSAYNNRGNALIELGRARQAVDEYRRALDAATRIDSPQLRVRILQNLARAQADSGDYAAAKATLDRAFALAETGPAAAWRPALYGVAAMVALREHELDRAADLIKRTFAGADAAQATMPMRDFHRTAYEIFRQRGDQAQALAHLEAFKKLDDESRSLTASAASALMTARFDFANQDLKINKLQLSQAHAQARIRAIILGGLLAGAAVISTLLAIGFFSIRRSRNQVRAANATLTETNAELGKALAAKSEFLATTSHEIRTPLNGILGMTQVILADRAVPAPLRSRIELVHGAGETMRALVDDILDVAKMETGELRIHPAEMNLQRLLEDAVTVWTGQAQTKNIGIDVDLADCPAGIVQDEVRLRQVVFNLMSNAIKFTDRGQVRLAARAVPDGAGEQLMIRIADTGIGIPPDKLAEIFESFRQVDGGTTRRHGGTGLGLAICRNLARAMGGDVAVESVLGTGSTFTVTLPLERVEIVVPEAVDRSAIGSLADAELLLLDANPLAQGIMRALLSPHVRGLQIVPQLEDALAAIAGGTIDHAVADGAALGLDPEAAGRFVEAAKAVGARATILWPNPSPEIIAALEQYGVSHFLIKPIAAPDLLAGLQMVYARDVASRDIAA